MRKRWLVSAVILLLTGECCAQWTKQDSLRVKKLLESDQELHLNRDVVKQIDFGSAVGTPRMSVEKNWLQPDESLPKDALPKPKVVLSLMPYKANTPYNWDPIYQRKIRVNENTWRNDPFYEMKTQREYTNVRITYYDTPANEATPIPGSRFGSMGMGAGSVIGGLDLMTIFTKDFWDKQGRERRRRTLDILKTYGDSTTVLFNQSIH